MKHNQKKQQKGYIKLHRKLLQWEWWGDELMVKAWIYCLLNATYKDIIWKGVTVVRGSFVTSMRHMAEDLDCTYCMVRSLLSRLQESKNIEYKCFNTHTLIVIVNYESYQAESECESLSESEIESENESEIESKNESENKSVNNPIKLSGVDIKTEKIKSVFESENKSVFESKNKSEIKSEKESYNNNIIKNNKKNKDVVVNAPVRACACEEIDIMEVAQWLKNESGEIWQESAMMNLGIKSKDELYCAFEKFQEECILQGKKSEPTKTIQAHFVNLMRIKKSKEDGNRNNQKGNIQHTDPRDLAKIARGMVEFEKSLRNG